MANLATGRQETDMAWAADGSAEVGYNLVVAERCRLIVRGEFFSRLFFEFNVPE